jgi:hypothetical protein
MLWRIVAGSFPKKSQRSASSSAWSWLASFTNGMKLFRLR